MSDLVGRFCWHVDAGDVDAWLALWTENGVFAGAGPKPAVGREALKAFPAMSVQMKMRHLVGNLHCTYGRTRDVAHARFYNLVTTWNGGGGAFLTMVICELTLVREGGGWLIKRNDSTIIN